MTIAREARSSETVDHLGVRRYRGDEILVRPVERDEEDHRLALE